MIKKISNIVYISLILSVVSGWAFSKDILPTAANILHENDKIIIIDVRNKSEWKETGIIPGAYLVQMLNPIYKIRKDFIQEITEVLGPDKNIEAAIICKGGGRSGATVSILKENGYINISNISEGMVGDGKITGWISRGLPTEKCLEKCK